MEGNRGRSRRRVARAGRLREATSLKPPFTRRGRVLRVCERCRCHQWICPRHQATIAQASLQHRPSDRSVEGITNAGDGYRPTLRLLLPHNSSSTLLPATYRHRASLLSHLQNVSPTYPCRIRQPQQCGRTPARLLAQQRHLLLQPQRGQLPLRLQHRHPR